MEWHGAVAIYVIGTLALIISAVHTAVTSQEKGILMNGFELEKNLDEKKYLSLIHISKPTCLGERPDRKQGAGNKAENRGKSVTSNKEKKSGAHFCGAVSGFAGYYFNDCRSCVDVIRKCGEYGCNLCCYCDECCAWNGSISHGRKIA